MPPPVPARGERPAIGGYLPQFGEFAWLAYRELLHGTLAWVRVAHPEAQQLDDILYATASVVYAYQVKWTIAGATISFSAFQRLLPSLVRSRQGLRDRYQPQHRQMRAHLLTNKALSTVAIRRAGHVLGTTAEFFAEAWQPLQAGQPPAARWQPLLAELARTAGLTAPELAEFARCFRFEPDYQAKDFSVRRAGHSQLDNDLTAFRSYLLEQVADPSRPVERTAAQLLADLGWEARFATALALPAYPRYSRPPGRTAGAPCGRLRVSGGYARRG